MTGRIRSVKPELLEDEPAAALSDAAWRLWVSSWLLADDHGRFRSGAKYLAASVWQDTAKAEKAEEAVQELAAGGFVNLYEVDGQRYAEVKPKGWQTHQRIDRPGRPRVPVPNEIDYLATKSRHKVLDCKTEPENVLQSRPSRARGGPPTSDLRPPTSDHDPDTGADRASRANDVYSVCQHWATQPYHSRAPVVSDQHKRVVKARLKDGFSADQLKLVVERWDQDDWLAGRTADGRKKKGLVEILQNADRINRLLESSVEDDENTVEAALARADATRKALSTVIPANGGTGGSRG